jgi:MFS family permease
VRTAPLPPPLAAALVFCASAAVLVLEILAVRLLAPYVGLTLETYTTVIGVCLAGIAAGAWLGGRAADRGEPRALLGPLLVAGGLLAAATLPLVRLLGDAGGGTVLVGLLSFLPAAAALSAVTPVVVKLQLRDTAETGSVVGQLSALSTAGALFGTFTTGFVLVAALPNAPIVIGVGLALVLAGVALSGSRALLVAALAGAAVVTGAGVAAGSPCDVESAYFCARVVSEDPARPTGRTLVLDDLRHAYVDLADPSHLEFRYTRQIGDVADRLAPPGAPIAALHLGGGGFTLPRYVNATRPGSRNVVLEVDRRVVDLGRERLGLRTGPALRVRVGDARVALRDEPDAAHDLVVGDAFGSLAVPWHLATRELLEDVRRVLRPSGVYALNLIDQRPGDFARAEAATLRAVFPHVAVAVPDDGGGNFVMLASERPLAGRVPRDWPERVVEGGAYARGAPVLTDAHAPVDQLLTPSAERR